MIGAADVRGKCNVVNRVGQGWECLYQLVQKQSFTTILLSNKFLEEILGSWNGVKAFQT